MVDKVGEVVLVSETNGAQHGPPPSPGGDVGDPVTGADGGGGEIILAGAGCETTLETTHTTS